MNRPTRASQVCSGYLDLQNRARRERRGTQEPTRQALRPAEQTTTTGRLNWGFGLERAKGIEPS